MQGVLWGRLAARLLAALGLPAGPLHCPPQQECQALCPAVGSGPARLHLRTAVLRCAHERAGCLHAHCWLAGCAHRMKSRPMLKLTLLSLRLLHPLRIRK